MLGMSMRVERSTLEQVRARLEAHKRKKEETKELGKDRERERMKLYIHPFLHFFIIVIISFPHLIFD
jgi:hypothetical protein